ncbi:hypothetical protein BC832DRAFT_594126 [Gaertneriomyces semiglobifer]|nr:hypothetical protein BC832DRAFT_594126 [Gaertneriomyces semiglobifer]
MEARQQPQDAKTATAAASKQKHLARLRNVRAKRRLLADEHHSTRQASRGSSEAEERDEPSSKEEDERLCRRKVPVAARAAEAFAGERPRWPEEMEVDWWSVGGGRRPGTITSSGNSGIREDQSVLLRRVNYETGGYAEEDAREPQLKYGRVSDAQWERQ